MDRLQKYELRYVDGPTRVSGTYVYLDEMTDISVLRTLASEGGRIEVWRDGRQVGVLTAGSAESESCEASSESSVRAA